MVIWAVTDVPSIYAEPHAKVVPKDAATGEALIGVNVTGKGTTIT